MTKTFAAEKIRLNLVDLISLPADPSAGGYAAAVGSFYLRSGTAGAYLKTGAGNTDWAKLALTQMFAWYSVVEYGAVGDGVTDDTSAIQAAIDACATAGGGVVYFPPGTYAVTQITINAQDNVQLKGTGNASVILWAWNAAAAAGSMLTITGSDHNKINNLVFDGSGLLNPDAGRDNHLIKVSGAGGTTELQIMNNTFQGMIAASGDGLHVVGTAGNLVSRIWACNNEFDGCSRYGVNYREGVEFGWIVENYLTNCETELAIVATNNVAINAMIVQGNEILHAAGSASRFAMRFEGAALLLSRIVVAANIVMGGFCTLTNVQYCTYDANIVTSGIYASADAVLRVFGLVSHAVILGNFFDRDPAASVGPVLTLESSGGLAPIYCRVGQNLLINETVAGGMVKLVDVTASSFGGNLMRSTDAGVSVTDAFDVQAVTVAATNLLIGPGNQITAAAGSFRSGFRLYNNGANITDISVVGNQGNQIDYGARFEGAASANFNGQLLYGGNNLNGTVGDYQEVGVVTYPRIGFNAGTFGSQLITGNGSPEGIVTARISSMYLRKDGGQATVVYYKESGTGNTGWVAIGGGVLVWGTGDTTAAATAVYLAPGWIAVSIATEIQMAVTRPGTIRNLRVQAATAGVTAATNTYTVRKNGVDTTLLASIDNTATGSTTDTVNSFTVVAGDLLSISVVKSGAVATGQANVTAAVELV